MTITSSILAQYTNGNVEVKLFTDGTKLRQYEGKPVVAFPESIDLKITDWCDAGCGFCHESSTVKGEHGKAGTILRIVTGLPAGVEIALGGGDPFAHPELEVLLRCFATQGLIVNITVNGKHVARHAERIREFRKARLLYGLGVSFDRWFTEDLPKVVDNNTVIHFIAGEHTPTEALNIVRKYGKILVLGYKKYGRGFKYYNPRVDNLLASWRYWIRSIIRQGVVCFDNLALEQLEMRKLLPVELWETCFLGGDGSHTMYADAVRDEFAVSSTSKRVSANGQTAIEFFKEGNI